MTLVDISMSINNLEKFICKLEKRGKA